MATSSGANIFEKAWKKMVFKFSCYGYTEKELISMLDYCKNADHRYKIPENQTFYGKVRKRMDKWHDHCYFEEMMEIKVMQIDGSVYTEEYDKPALVMAVVKITITRSWMDSIKSRNDIPDFILWMCNQVVPCLLPIRQMADGMVYNFMNVKNRKDKSELIKRRNWFSRHMCALRFLCKEVMKDTCGEDRHICTLETRCTCEELFHLTFYFICNFPIFSMDARLVQKLQICGRYNAIILDKAEILMFSFMALMPNQQRFNNISLFFGDSSEETTKRYESIGHYKDRLVYYLSSICTDHILPVNDYHDTGGKNVIFNFRIDIRRWDFFKFNVISVVEAYDILMRSVFFLSECLILHELVNRMSKKQLKNWMCLFFEKGFQPYSFRIAYENSCRYSAMIQVMDPPLVLEAPGKRYFVIINCSLYMAMQSTNLSYVSCKRERFKSPVAYSPLMLRNWYRNPIIYKESQRDSYTNKSDLRDIGRFSVIKTLMHWISYNTRKGGEDKIFRPEEEQFHVYELLPAIVCKWEKQMIMDEFRDQYKKEMLEKPEKYPHKDTEVDIVDNEDNSGKTDSPSRQEDKIGRCEDIGKFLYKGKKRKRNAQRIFTDEDFKPHTLLEVILIFFRFHESHLIKFSTFNEIRSLITEEKYDAVVEKSLPTDFKARMMTEFRELSLFFQHKSPTFYKGEYISGRFVRIEFDTTEDDDPQWEAWPEETPYYRNILLLKSMYRFMTSDILPSSIQRRWIKTITLSTYVREKLSVNLTSNFRSSDNIYLTEKMAQDLSCYCDKYLYDNLISSKVDSNGRVLRSSYNDTEFSEGSNESCFMDKFSNNKKITFDNAYKKMWMNLKEPCDPDLVNSFDAVFWRNTGYANEEFTDDKICEATKFHSFLAMLEWCCFFYQKEIWPQDKRKVIKNYKRRKKATDSFPLMTTINDKDDSKKKKRKSRKKNERIEKCSELIKKAGFDGYLALDVERILNGNEICSMCVSYDNGFRSYDMQGMFLFEKKTSSNESFYNKKPGKIIHPILPGSTRSYDKYKDCIDPSNRWDYTDVREIMQEEANASYFPLVNILSLYYGYMMDTIMNSVTMGRTVLQLKPIYCPGWQPFRKSTNTST